jgi:hypothetical protein
VTCNSTPTESTWLRRLAKGFSRLTRALVKKQDSKSLNRLVIADELIVPGRFAGIKKAL